MSKTTREVEFKFYLCYLDAVLDNNPTLETIEIEDNVTPEQYQSKNLSANFRLKNIARQGNVHEKVFIKIS